MAPPVRPVWKPLDYSLFDIYQRDTNGNILLNGDGTPAYKDQKNKFRTPTISAPSNIAVPIEAQGKTTHSTYGPAISEAKLSEEAINAMTPNQLEQNYSYLKALTTGKGAADYVKTHRLVSNEQKQEAAEKVKAALDLTIKRLNDYRKSVDTKNYDIEAKREVASVKGIPVEHVMKGNPYEQIVAKQMAIIEALDMDEIDEAELTRLILDYNNYINTLDEKTIEEVSKYGKAKAGGTSAMTNAEQDFLHWFDQVMRTRYQ